MPRTHALCHKSPGISLHWICSDREVGITIRCLCLVSIGSYFVLLLSCGLLDLLQMKYESFHQHALKKISVFKTPH